MCRNWESLFPKQSKPAGARKPGTSKLLVAGGLHAVDLDLQRMQVRQAGEVIVLSSDLHELNL